MSRHSAWLPVLIVVLGWTVGCTTGKTQTEPDKPSVPIDNPITSQTALLLLEGRCDPDKKIALIDVAWPQNAVKGDIRVEMTVYPQGFERGFYSICKVGRDTSLSLDERSDKSPAIREMGLLTPKIQPVAERNKSIASAKSYTESYLTLEDVSPGMNYQVRLIANDEIIATETMQAPICLKGKLRE